MVIFLYNLDIFVWIQHGYLANIVLTLDPSSCVIKRLLCIFYSSKFMFARFGKIGLDRCFPFLENDFQNLYHLHRPSFFSI